MKMQFHSTLTVGGAYGSATVLFPCAHKQYLNRHYTEERGKEHAIKTSLKAVNSLQRFIKINPHPKFNIYIYFFFIILSITNGEFVVPCSVSAGVSAVLFASRACSVSGLC